MKKIVMALLGLALASIFVVAMQSSATAVQTTCVPAHQGQSNEGSVTVCLNYSKDAGSTGFYVYWIRGSCDPFIYGVGPIAGWDDIAVDGHSLEIWRADDTFTRKFYRDDTDSNIHLDSGGTNQCTRTWTVNEHYANMNHLFLDYQFTEQRNNNSDIDSAITMNLINGS